MADDVTVTAGTISGVPGGTVIAADEIGGTKYQRIKLVLGADGAADNDVDSGQQLSAASVPVVLASDHSDVPITLDGEAVVLGAGTAGIGKLTANSGVDIGDVDVTSQVAGSGGDTQSNRDVDTTAEQGPSIAAKFGVTVRAAPGNSGVVYVGSSDVTAGTTDATDGFPLQAGESITVPVANANQLYVIGGAANQIVYYFAL